jgi:phospholipid/cholesterol/gamma-HCH transport system permease protein
MRKVEAAFEDFGRMILFAVEAVAWAFRPPFRPDLIVSQMAFIGVGSAFIVGATGLAAGMVFALQMNYALKQFAAEGFVGGSVAFSLARELSPVFTALMVTGRAGSAIATELGTMRVTEQIDAMESMAVNPIQYLVVPRIIASILMFPVLTMVFNVIGYAGGFVMGVYVARIPIGPFLESARHLPRALQGAGVRRHRLGRHHLARLRGDGRGEGRRGGDDARGGDELDRGARRRLRHHLRLGGDLT